MKKIFHLKGRMLLLAIILCSTSVWSQFTGNTYAVVIGISGYKESSIPALRFADKDARFFAEFLQSKSGGNTPAENIILLLNEQATVGTIYQALTHLLEVVKPNDLVYFYFSGHGDVENKIVSNLGYLLAYNSPTNNYINHAIRLEDLNDIANTLSAERNAKVVLITDACRSGKLAGNDLEGRSGKQLVAEQLLKTQQNEVRLIACGPDELSVENEAWGGGRGVFSYYLIRGLYGLAGNDSMPVVTSGEMKQYLTVSMANDPVLLREDHQQVPVLQGSDSITLSNVDSILMAEMKTEEDVKKVLPGTLASLPDLKGKINKLPLDYFFTILKPTDLILNFNLPTIKTLKTEEIPFRLIDGIEPTLNNKGYDSLRQLTKLLKTNKSLIDQFNNKLVSMITDMGQQLVIGYCNGDESEIEKRTYYGQSSNNYEKYVDLYDIALNIISPNHFLYRPLQLDRLYFSGVIQRSKFPNVPDPSDLLAKALDFQLQAYNLEPFAPYINNELGILYTEKKQYDSAFYYYTKATELSPGWALPWANLIAYYNITGNLTKAREMAEKARAIQPDLYILLSNEGITEELAKNWLRAEELQLKNIKANEYSYFPYERLGQIYIRTARFQKAEEQIRISYEKKRGFFFENPSVPNALGFRPNVPPQISANIGAFICPPYPKDTLFNSPYFDLLVATNLQNNSDTTLALERFKQILNNGGDSVSLVNHYYGKWLYQHQKFAEAEWFLKKANTKPIHPEQIVMFLDSIPSDSTNEFLTSCLKEKVMKLLYDPLEDDYYLGDIYKKLGYLDQAVGIYRSIIQRDNSSEMFPAAYFLLADLYQQYQQYQEAEQVWLDYRNTVSQYLIRQQSNQTTLYKILNTSNGEFELENFYVQMSAIEPGSSYWNDKSAEYWYSKIMTIPDAYIYTDSALEMINKGLPEWHRENSLIVYKMAIENMEPIPGIDQQIPFKDPVTFPFKRAISIIRSAFVYGEKYNKKTQANRLGKLYQLSGDNQKAEEEFLTALSLSPGETSQRMKITEIFLKRNEFTKAYQQMNDLLDQKKLLLEDLDKFAEMSIYKNDSLPTEQVLLLAKKNRIWKKEKLESLYGLFYFVNEDWDKALPYYMDSSRTEMPAADRFYITASIYMNKGDTASAKIWLKNSMLSGFAYRDVLQEDLVWIPLRKEPFWDEVLQLKPQAE